MSRPNVLFIISDDHQYDALGVLGHPVVQTPVLDTLAHRGTIFAQTSIMGSLMPAICSPSRACLLTGANLFRSNTDPRPGGGSEDFVTIPSRLATLPERFGTAGYETFITGKWHNDTASLLRSFQQGRTIFHGGMCPHREVPVRDLAGVARGDAPVVGPGFSTEIFCQSACDFLRSRKAEKPFFIWLALTSPHDPRTPPEEYRNRYAPADLPLPPAFAPEPAFDNGELQVRDELLCEKPLQPEVLRQHLADYYGMISHQDREIGRVLEALRASGQEENTLIVYVGDHGLALGRNGLLGKQNLYEHSVRVPMILVGPGVPSGRTDQALTYSMDLFATLLDLAGLSVPEYLDSLSLLPRLNHRGGGERRELFSLYRDCQRSLRDDRWKLIEYKVNSTRHTQLFDLSIDPHEGQDRAGDPAQTEIIRSMRDRLRTWQKRLGDRWMTLEPESSDHSMRV